MVISRKNIALYATNNSQPLSYNSAFVIFPNRFLTQLFHKKPTENRYKLTVGQSYNSLFYFAFPWLATDSMAFLIAS